MSWIGRFGWVNLVRWVSSVGFVDWVGCFDLLCSFSYNKNNPNVWTFEKLHLYNAIEEKKFLEWYFKNVQPKSLIEIKKFFSL